MPRDPLPERAFRIVLYLYLLWLPLPFGSVIDSAQLPLIAGATLICAAASLVRLRGGGNSVSPACTIWSAGAIAFIAVVAIQLVPLSDSLLRIVSPESASIWSDASNAASLVTRAPLATSHSISVDPGATWLHLFRFIAFFAIFLAAMLLIRRHRHRMELAIVLGIAAVFEALYGVRAAALHDYAIWGSANTKIFNRVTGTFVNPNHFAHYVALILPLTLFIAAEAWHASAIPGAPFGRNVARLIEHRAIWFGFAAFASLACVGAVLVAQSRGALLSIAVGFAAVASMALQRSSRKRRHNTRVALRVGLGLAAGALLVVGLAQFLGTGRTAVARLSDVSSMAGRRDSLAAAVNLWRLFPIFGSGLGTFSDVVSMVQSHDLDVIYNHAHNDYAEIAATTGAVGFAVSILPLLAGYAALALSTLRDEASWRGRAFRIAALTSITIALVHELFDFNFFIPANPATLAAIAGAAVVRRSVPAAETDSASSG